MKRKNSVVDREAEEEEKSSKQKISSLAELESEDDDDEEMDGMSEEGESGAEEESSDDEEAAEAQNKPTKKGLSAEEVQVARETSELFKSNIFKMQIDELIGELKLDPKQVQIVNKALHQINNAVEGVSDRVHSYNLVEAEKMFGKNSKDKIVIPFPDPKPSKDVQYKFGFAKPDYVTVLGSFSLHTAVKQPEGVGIDLYVNMPDELFQAKDYLNYRYVHKRAFYLACLARELKGSLEKLDPPMEMSYSYLNEDLLRPILQLTVANSTKKKHKFHINILPGTSSTVFEPRKLGPDRNCVRLDREDTSTLPATVFYNSSVLSDTSYRAYSEFLHRAKRMCEGFNEACILGRLWLRQRGFGSSIRSGGFGHFEWAMLMAALLNGSGNQRVLMAGYSSYQLFKATVRFLATQKTGLSVSFSTQKDQHTKAEDKNLDFASPAKLFDRDFKLNLLWKMSAWSFNLLKHEAAVTCDLLTDVVKDRFDPILLKNISNPHLHFDTVFSVSFESGPYLPEDKIKHMSYKHYVVEKLYRALSRGYGDRVKQIALIDQEPKQAFSLSKRREGGSNNEGTVLVGLILDPQECEKVMTHGPSVEEEEESERFRRFWGKKSELRRFQDGRISETIVWNTNANKLVVHTIAEYLLERHFSDCKAQVNFTHDQISKYLPTPGNSEISISNTKLFQTKNTAFQKLSNLLQDMSTTEVPLRVKAVSPTSPSLRFASIHQPLPFDLNGDDAVANAVIEFESSSRWPDDLKALEKTKIAFMLKISEQLEKKDYVSFVGVDENYIKAGVEVGFLDVQSQDGFMFRFRVATEKDLAMYQKVQLELPYEQHYHGAVTHHRMVYRMALRFPFYSPAVRLLKQWFSSQLLLDSQIKQEAVELLALIPFLDSAPYIPPSSAVTAFYRTLDFISRWDWREEGVFLDVDKSRDVSMDDEDSSLLTPIEGARMNQALYQQLQTAFSSHKENDPALTLAPMFIGTKVDVSGILWTRQAERSDVAKVVASRITALARAAGTIHDKTMLFVPSYSDYNVVINVKDPHGVSSTKHQFKNLTTHFPSLDKTVNAIADVTTMFFKDLQEKYKHSMILFYSPKHKAGLRRPADNVITAIWHRDILQGRKFKVNLDYSTIPQDDGDVVEVNKPAIIEEIKRIGGDLILDITF